MEKGALAKARKGWIIKAFHHGASDHSKDNDMRTRFLYIKFRITFQREITNVITFLNENSTEKCDVQLHSI